MSRSSIASKSRQWRHKKRDERDEQQRRKITALRCRCPVRPTASSRLARTDESMRRPTLRMQRPTGTDLSMHRIDECEWKPGHDWQCLRTNKKNKSGEPLTRLDNRWPSHGSRQRSPRANIPEPSRLAKHEALQRPASVRPLVGCSEELGGLSDERLLEHTRKLRAL